MKLRTMLINILTFPLRFFMRMASLSRDMFCPGRGDPECRYIQGRGGRSSGRYRRHIAGDNKKARWRYINYRIRAAAKRIEKRGSQLVASGLPKLPNSGTMPRVSKKQKNGVTPEIADTYN